MVIHIYSFTDIVELYSLESSKRADEGHNGSDLRNVFFQAPASWSSCWSLSVNWAHVFFGEKIFDIFNIFNIFNIFDIFDIFDIYIYDIYICVCVCIYLPYRYSCCILLPGRSSTSLRVHPAPGRRFSHDGVSAALLGALGQQSSGQVRSKAGGNSTWNSPKLVLPSGNLT
jgi:hypothetical protein